MHFSVKCAKSVWLQPDIAPPDHLAGLRARLGIAEGQRKDRMERTGEGKGQETQGTKGGSRDRKNGKKGRHGRGRKRERKSRPTVIYKSRRLW